jgi:glutamyl-tRNA synthetase
MDDVREVIRKRALQNALFYGGKAQKGAVLGKLMAARPDLRPRAREITSLVEEVLEGVNSMGLDDIRAELADLDPSLLQRPGGRDREEMTRLPDLKGAEGPVTMRFAPSPSGPLHIGHSRAAILNDEYVKRYGGELILRLEDTNPANIMEEAYDWIPGDMEWLGVKLGRTVVQSDRFDEYLARGRKLLELGGAYVCTCDVERWRALKNASEPCPHREREPGEQLADWDGMLDGGYAPGEASMVVKTDLAHSNPAVRDFVAFRIVDTPHPRTGDRHRVYPMYNFSVVVDDHLMGMTHVLRGKDHLNNTIRQGYVYRYMGWKVPLFTHYGWVSIEETILKTTTIKEGIADGRFSGWDDVRLGTFRSLARRGYDPNSLRRYWLEVGIKDVDINFSWETLNAMNKELVDPLARRYSFVADPVPLHLKGAPEGGLRSSAPLFPGQPEMGAREHALVPDGTGSIQLMVSGEDGPSFMAGITIRLKDLCNLEVTGAAGVQGAEGAEGGEGTAGGPAEVRAAYSGNDRSVVKSGAPIIHWTPADGAVAGAVQMPDGSTRRGVFEPGLLEYLREAGARVVQLERFGFANLSAEGEKIEGAFLHG